MKTNMKKVFVVLYAMLALASFSVVSAAKQEASPDWVKNLPQAKTAKQLFVVAGVGKTTAWVSMHEKDTDGNWRILMTTPGFLGKEGLEKTKEGDAKTPIGTFHFNAAFGIAKDPGCVIPYKQVDKNIYWSGDDRPGMKYNQMVDIREMPDLNIEDSEHIIDYDPHYTYAMNISYNEDGTPGLGSAIFLHCFGPYKPYTGGCVAIPVENMRFVMQNVRPDCVIVIDYLKKLSPETAEKWKI